jgi:hypothetical protein
MNITNNVLTELVIGPRPMADTIGPTLYFHNPVNKQMAKIIGLCEIERTAPLTPEEKEEARVMWAENRIVTMPNIVKVKCFQVEYITGNQEYINMEEALAQNCIRSKSEVFKDELIV